MTQLTKPSICLTLLTGALAITSSTSALWASCARQAANQATTHDANDPRAVESPRQEPQSQDPESQPTAGTAPAETDAPDTEFEAFVARVDVAHRGAPVDGEARETFDRFQGTIGITPMQPDADSIEVRIAARFLGPDLLRYAVEESGRIIESGIDAKGGWGRIENRVYGLTGKEYSTDRRQVAQHRRLARQLLRFLDPAATLRRLQNRSKVETRDLQVGRTKWSGCDYIAGDLDGFPLYVAEGAPRRVRLELWAEKGLIVGLRATALPEQQAEGAPAEELPPTELAFFPKYAAIDSVQVPAEIIMCVEHDPTVGPDPIARIVVETLELRPELDAEDFSRPKT